MRATFRGATYQCKARKIADSKDCLAYCTDRNGKIRKILFDLDEIPDRDLIEILIHESLHACLWDLDEEAVEATGRDIATFLKQLGVTIDASRVRTILRPHGTRRTSPRRASRRHASKS